MYLYPCKITDIKSLINQKIILKIPIKIVIYSVEELHSKINYILLK